MFMSFHYMKWHNLLRHLLVDGDFSHFLLANTAVVRAFTPRYWPSTLMDSVQLFLRAGIAEVMDMQVFQVFPLSRQTAPQKSCMSV